MIDATHGEGPALVEACLALGANVLAGGRLRTALDELRASLRHHERLAAADCDPHDADGVARLVAGFAPTDVLCVPVDTQSARAVADAAGRSGARLVVASDLDLGAEGLLATGEPAASIVASMLHEGWQGAEERAQPGSDGGAR